MSTYNQQADVQPRKLAKSESINNLDNAVAAAFALLPDETDLKHGTVSYAADSGTVNAYVVALSQVPDSYTDGLKVVIKPANTNTGASTINVNSLGVKSIRHYDSSVLTAGDLQAGAPTVLRYSSTTGFFHVQPNSIAAAETATTKAAEAEASASAAASSASAASSSAAAAAASEQAVIAMIATAVPTGCILMWSGSIATIPSGFALCDGTSGTPNLTDRFVIHADADLGGTNNVGDIGGSWDHTHTDTLSVDGHILRVAEMPSHNHVQRLYNGVDAKGPGITSPGSGLVGSSGVEQSGTADLTTKWAGSSSSHNHGLSGSVTSVTTKPKYYALAYIMKT